MEEAQKRKLQTLREELAELRQKKLCKFDDIDPLIRKILYGDFSGLFPRKSKGEKGSKHVYHPNVPGCWPISIEQEHGSREYLPRKYAHRALDQIESLLDYIESNL